MLIEKLSRLGEGRRRKELENYVRLVNSFEEDVKELSDAYLFLRNVEHRLQYLDDAQRHDLPQDDEDQGRLARMCSFSSWDQFRKALETHRSAVSRHFEAVFAQPHQESEPWPEHPRLAALRSSQRYAALPDESRRRLDAVIPALARATRSGADPESATSIGMRVRRGSSMKRENSSFLPP